MMCSKITIYIIGFILCCYSANAQDTLSPTNDRAYSVQLDTLRLQSLDKPYLAKSYQSNAMPWIVALTIGLLSVVANVLISKHTRKTSVEIAKQQIKSQFETTINAKNRQDWIIDVRETLSEFFTQCKMLNIEFQMRQLDVAGRNTLHEKLTFNRAKLQLLLSDHLELHKDLLEAMKVLIDMVDLHMLKGRSQMEDFDNFEFMEKSNKVIECGKKLLYAEWQKIQKTSFF